MTPKLNPMQELNFQAWAQGEGVQPTDDMRRLWMNPKGFDDGGVIGDAGDGGGFSYPYPFDPSNPPAPKLRGMEWSPEPGGGLDFLGDNTFEKGVQNVMAAARSAMSDPVVKAMGETWYRAAYDWVAYMLRATGSDMEIDRAIAICAQLSENTDWWTNMMRFRRFLSGDMKITGDPYAVGQSLYDQVQKLARADDPIAAVRGQKPFNFFWSIKRAAQDIPQPVLHAGQEFDDPVAMDRWAKRIAMGVSDQPDAMFGDKKLFDIVDALQSKGDYPAPIGPSKWSKSFDLMADMYREAAKRLNVPFSEVLQALTWVAEGPTKNDPTIQYFREHGEWKFPLTDEDVAQTIIDSVKENPDGFTFDVTGEAPTEGMAYAPDKTTEFKLAPGDLSKESIVKYIREHPRMWLKGSGGNIGGWIDADGALTLDISRVGDVSTKTIAAAQKAEQDAVFDLARGKELVVGQTIRDADGNPTGYVKADTPKKLLAQHLADDAPAPTPTPAPEPEPLYPVQEAKPLPKRLKPMGQKELPEGRGSGPGSAMAPDELSTLGKIGRVAGPVLQGLGDAATAYGIVGQAAQQGIDKQLAEGHSYVQQGDVLGIPYGQAFQGPSAKPGDPSSGVVSKPMTPQDYPKPKSSPEPSAPDVSKIPQSTVDLAAQSGNPIRGTKPSPGLVQPAPLPGAIVGPGAQMPPPAPSATPLIGGGAVQMQVVVKHPSGPPSVFPVKQTGPNQYEAPTIPLGPGDEMYMNGKRVR